MNFLWERLVEWLKDLLVGGVMSNLSGLFDGINGKVSEIAGTVGATPQGWNSGVFNMVRNLSENVVVPIAGIILTFVMTYELIQMIIDRNNMHDFETFNFFKWIFKTFVRKQAVGHEFVTYDGDGQVFLPRRRKHRAPYGQIIPEAGEFRFVDALPVPEVMGFNIQQSGQRHDDEYRQCANDATEHPEQHSHGFSALHRLPLLNRLPLRPFSSRSSARMKKPYSTNR